MFRLLVGLTSTAPFWTVTSVAASGLTSTMYRVPRMAVTALGVRTSHEPSFEGTTD
jgi:hypothetical protein